jgi:hypothetical protein
LDPDVEDAVDRMRKESGMGLSETVNALARRGAICTRADYTSRPVSFDIGVTDDVSNIGGVLEVLDEIDAAH